jgi:EmrB/QacA subfamily drug resistance transporter
MLPGDGETCMTRDRWITLVVVSAATAMLLLDVTVVNVALPVIGADLDASFDELQWVIDAYALTLAATLLSAGALADRLGRRRVFAVGLALFTVFSALCGAATSGVVLDFARGLQGVGAAAMFAASLAILAEEFQGRERGFALGVWGAITGAALALGPLVGGALVDAINWRWVFFVNVPIGAALLWMTLRRVPESRDTAPRGLDVGGLVTFGAAAFLLTFALIRGNVDGWGSATVAGSLAAAVALLAAFVVIERGGDSPMLPPALFRIPAFTGTAVVAFAQSFALYPLFLFLAIYLQGILGHSPTGTGLRLLPLTLVLLAVAPLSGRLTSRVELRVPLVSGLVLIAGSLLLMRGPDPAAGWTDLLPGFVVGGVAIGVISPALAAAMVGVLSQERSGLASGVNNTFRQLGIAVGIAALGAIFQHHVGLGAPRSATAVVDALDAILLVAAAVALAGAALAWPLLGTLRSAQNVASPQAGLTSSQSALKWQA